MKVTPTSSISSKGLPARKLEAPKRGAKMAVLRHLKQAKKNEAENGALIIKMNTKILPKAVNPEDTVSINASKTRKITACGTWAMQCGGGYD